MPNPHIFIAPYLLREAVLSSRIEGTRTKLDQLLVEEAVPRSHSDDDDAREVQNYVVALEEGIGLLQELPLSLRLVRELHRRLMRSAYDLMRLREELRNRVRMKPQALALVDELFRNPYVTIARAARALGTTNPTGLEAAWAASWHKLPTVLYPPGVPTRNVVLTNEQENLVQSLVRSGRYQNASEVVREGLRLIERREAEYVAKLDALRAAVSEGITALEKGTFTEFSDAGSMSRYLDGLSDRSTSGASKRH